MRGSNARKKYLFNLKMIIMSKIGRNDLCKCGSGKKYKKCCMNQATPVAERTLLTPPANITTCPEEEVLGGLLSRSERFQKFYAEVREDLGHITWVKGDNLAQKEFGYRMGQRGKMIIRQYKGKTEKFIVLDNIPPKEDDEIIVAHEMGHIVILNRGFPSISPRGLTGISPEEKNARINLSSSISNIIHDPLCDELLMQAGYSFNGMYEKSVKDFLRITSSQEEPPMNTYCAHESIFRHVLRVINGQYYPGDRALLEEYLDFFNTKFPNMARKGQSVLSAMEYYGYDTPEKVFLLYNEIISQMDLENICRVVSIKKE